MYDMSGWNSDIQTNLSLGLFDFPLQYNHIQIYFLILVMQLVGIGFVESVTLLISALMHSSMSVLAVSLASYTYILQSSYTKTALETEITRDTASADAVHKLVNGKIGKEDFDQIKDQSDEKKQLYKDISSYFNEIRTLNSTRYIYTATKNEEGNSFMW
mgnify:CR=1 FL=1